MFEKVFTVALQKKEAVQLGNMLNSTVRYDNCNSGRLFVEAKDGNVAVGLHSFSIEAHKVFTAGQCIGAVGDVECAHLSADKTFAIIQQLRNAVTPMQLSVSLSPAKTAWIDLHEVVEEGVVKEISTMLTGSEKLSLLRDKLPNMVGAPASVQLTPFLLDCLHEFAQKPHKWGANTANRPNLDGVCIGIDSHGAFLNCTDGHSMLRATDSVADVVGGDTEVSMHLIPHAAVQYACRMLKVLKCVSVKLTAYGGGTYPTGLLFEIGDDFVVRFYRETMHTQLQDIHSHETMQSISNPDPEKTNDADEVQKFHFADDDNFQHLSERLSNWQKRYEDKSQRKGNGCGVDIIASMGSDDQIVMVGGGRYVQGVPMLNLHFMNIDEPVYSREHIGIGSALYLHRIFSALHICKQHNLLQISGHINRPSFSLGWDSKDWQAVKEEHRRREVGNDRERWNATRHHFVEAAGQADGKLDENGKPIFNKHKSNIRTLCFTMGDEKRQLQYINTGALL